MSDGINRVTLRGRLATPPELKVFESGTRMWRLLVTVRTTEPTKRVDVIPVTYWSPELAVDRQLDLLEADRCVVVRGAIQRRFWDDSDGRRSRMEVVAHSVLVIVDTKEADDGSVVSEML